MPYEPNILLNIMTQLLPLTLVFNFELIFRVFNYVLSIFTKNVIGTVSLNRAHASYQNYINDLTLSS